MTIVKSTKLIQFQINHAAKTNGVITLKSLINRGVANKLRLCANIGVMVKRGQLVKISNGKYAIAGYQPTAKPVVSRETSDEKVDYVEPAIVSRETLKPRTKIEKLAFWIDRKMESFADSVASVLNPIADKMLALTGGN